MKLIDNIPVWGEPVDKSALSQIKTCAKTAAAVALMADHHKGYAVPIGGVVAYYDSISPSGVGFDIACGNKAVLLDMPVVEIRANIRKIMDDIWHKLSTNDVVTNSLIFEALRIVYSSGGSVS